MSRGQSKRWYRFCFVTTSADSSDDSDTESASVVQAPSPGSSNNTWEQDPLPVTTSSASATENTGLNPQPQIDREIFLPPLPSLLPAPLSQSVVHPELTPVTTSSGTRRNTRAPGSDLEPQIDRQIFRSLIEQFSFSPPPRPSLLPAPPFIDQDLLSPFSPLEQGWSESDAPPVPDDVIDAIRTVRISESDQSHCPICMEEFKVGELASRLPCNHTYSSECINRWLNNKKTCPVCRLQLDDWERRCGEADEDDGSDRHSRHENSVSLGLVSEPEIIPAGDSRFLNPISTSWNWEDFYNNFDEQFPNLNEGEDSDGTDYDTAFDELDDSHGDGDVVGVSQT